MNFFDLIWVFLIVSSLIPVLRQRYIDSLRNRLIRNLELARGSRVITLIHRQETVSFLGIPLSRYIDIEDSEDLLRAIRLTPADLPIDLILHTPGGLVLAAEQIAHALVRHKAPVTVFVPHYAMSGGTLLALSADGIIMDPNAVLGPVDPQLGQYPAASILKVLEQKELDRIGDETLIMADMARKALGQMNAWVTQLLLTNGMTREHAEQIVDTLATGRVTHDFPISFEEAQALGLPVSDSMPKEIYALMSLYPQPRGRRPSVEYIPLPYQAPNPQLPPGPANPRGGGEKP